MWNYRIIKNGDSYGLYETFYNDDSEISAHDKSPTIVGESVEEIEKSLKMMLSDVDRCKDSILEYDKIEFAPFCDPDEKMISYDIDDLDKLLDE
jgi:hypothetical protein